MNKMKRNNNQIRRCLISSFMAVLLLITMNGCSLAVDVGDGARSRDYLIGAIITREEIEKTDGEVIWKEDRIEALQFEGIQGNYLVYTTWKMNDGTVAYGTAGTKGIDSHANYGTKDEKGSIELTINAYVAPKEAEEYCSIYMNPIYMTKDEEVYTVGGVELKVNTEDAKEGASTGRSYSEKEKLRWIDSEIEVSVNVMTNLYVAEQPVKITFSEMDENHKVVKKTEYEPGKVPEVINAEEETAYILVESELSGLLGQNKTNFEMCSWDGLTTYEITEEENGKELNGEVVTAGEQNATLTDTFYASPNGLLLKNSTWVIWPE